MTTRAQLAAVVAAVVAAAGCASSRASPPSSGLPREAIPSTFAPLRWSVRSDVFPALFPNRQARQGTWDDSGRHVSWTVQDVRRIGGVPGALVADFTDAGDLWRARLSFADPRRDCDPDYRSPPSPCADPGPALSGVYDALQAELARGRGAPQASPPRHGARTASWRGDELELLLSLTPDERGAWSVRATVVRAGAARAAPAR